MRACVSKPPSQKNHLSGVQRPFLRVGFKTVQDLMEVKRQLAAIVGRNKGKLEASAAYEALNLGNRWGWRGGLGWVWDGWAQSWVSDKTGILVFIF